jgi:protein-L-isoaspartate(D-aspartate) O-methyltransferase
MFRIKPTLAIVVGCFWIVIGCLFGVNCKCKNQNLYDKVMCTKDSKKMEPNWDSLRAEMIEQQILGRGVNDEQVLNAMRKIPRHEFIPQSLRSQAYEDYPVPIGHDQTISQPYIVAYMSSLLNVQSGEKVLEIGTGSGYQAAVLAEMGAEVYTIEIIEALALQAQITLARLGYNGKIKVKWGDGYLGWEEYAPYDAIIVTCAPEEIPQPLKDQLAVDGIIVIPVGEENTIQELVIVEKNSDSSFNIRPTIPVRFVPMTREKREN